jgi:hypothetical protein
MSYPIEQLPQSTDEFVVVRRDELEDLQQKIRILWNSMTTQCCGGSTFQADLSLMQEAGVASSRLVVRPLDAVMRGKDATPLETWVTAAHMKPASAINVSPD